MAHDSTGIRTRSILALAACVGVVMLTSTPALAAKKAKPVAPPAVATDNNSARPDGLWATTVTFTGNPPAAPGFAFFEQLTLHKNGTVTETNSILNAASGGNPPNFLVGSDGQGTWEHSPGGKVRVEFYKMLFCGSAPAEAAQAPCKLADPDIPPGGFLGYLRVRFTADITGDKLTSPVGESETVLIPGPDPLGVPTVNFGPASVVGERLSLPK